MCENASIRKTLSGIKNAPRLLTKKLSDVHVSHVLSLLRRVCTAEAKILKTPFVLLQPIRAQFAAGDFRKKRKTKNEKLHPCRALTGFHTFCVFGFTLELENFRFSFSFFFSFFVFRFSFFRSAKIFSYEASQGTIDFHLLRNRSIFILLSGNMSKVS